MTVARRLGHLLAPGIVLAWLAAATSAHGQPFDPGQNAKLGSVGGRANTDFEPIGLELGNFLIHARSTNDGEYNDNIFRDNSKSSDFIGHLKPSISISGEFLDTNLSLNVDADVGRYAEFHTENYEDFNLVASANRDITEESNITVTGRHARIHEPRGTINDPGRQFGPTQFDFNTITFLPQYSVTPFILLPKIEGRQISYLPTGPIDNEDRSENQLFLNTRVGYQFDPGWTIFVEPSYEIRAFARRRDVSRLNHDQEIYQVLSGFAYDATADIFVDLGAGYFIDNFFAGAQHDINGVRQPGQLSGVAFNGSLVWNFSPDFTLTGTLSRSIQDVQATNRTSNPTAPVVGTATTEITSMGTLRLDYEAADNLLLFVTTGLTRDDLSVTKLSEDTVTFELGGTYYFNEYLSLGAHYIFEVRGSTRPLRRIDGNRIIFSLITQL